MKLITGVVLRRSILTWPKRLEDSHSHAIATQDHDNVNYSEGVFIGYRYFDTKRIGPQFPFGYGLSYATFAYANLHPDTQAGNVLVSSEVKNTSKHCGTEIGELYVGAPASPAARPVHELKGFARVTLDPSQTMTLHLTLDPHAFAYWDEIEHDWKVIPGTYNISLGASSHDIRLTSDVKITEADASALNNIVGKSQKSPQVDSADTSKALR